MSECTQTQTHTQPFYGSLDFVQDNPGELVPEETFTHPKRKDYAPADGSSTGDTMTVQPQQTLLKRGR